MQVSVIPTKDDERHETRETPYRYVHEEQADDISFNDLVRLVFDELS